jgi:hypothetical protein
LSDAAGQRVKSRPRVQGVLNVRFAFLKPYDNVLKTVCAMPADLVDFKRVVERRVTCRHLSPMIPERTNRGRPGLLGQFTFGEAALFHTSIRDYVVHAARGNPPAICVASNPDARFNYGVYWKILAV